MDSYRAKSATPFENGFDPIVDVNATLKQYAAEITRLRHLLAAKTIEIDQLRNTVRQNDRQSPLPPMSPTPAVSTDRVDIKALQEEDGVHWAAPVNASKENERKENTMRSIAMRTSDRDSTSSCSERDDSPERESLHGDVLIDDHETSPQDTTEREASAKDLYDDQDDSTYKSRSTPVDHLGLAGTDRETDDEEFENVVIDPIPFVPRSEIKDRGSRSTRSSNEADPLLRDWLKTDATEVQENDSGSDDRNDRDRNNQIENNNNAPVTMEMIREGIRDLKTSLRKWTLSAPQPVKTQSQKHRSTTDHRRSMHIENVSKASSKASQSSNKH